MNVNYLIYCGIFLNRYLLITGFIFLLSCATQLRHIDDEYKHNDYSNSRLAIVLPNTNEFIINNPDDVSDDLDTAGTGNVQKVFRIFFKIMFFRLLIIIHVLKTYIGSNDPIPYPPIINRIYSDVTKTFHLIYLQRITVSRLTPHADLY